MVEMFQCLLQFLLLVSSNLRVLFWVQNRPFRTFLTKLLRIWSGIYSEVRIFQKIAKLTHEIGFFWHLLNESAAPFERVNQCQFHGESPGESGFFY